MLLGSSVRTRDAALGSWRRNRSARRRVHARKGAPGGRSSDWAARGKSAGSCFGSTGSVRTERQGGQKREARTDSKLPHLSI
ncbi:hypothetical protein ACFX2J_032343 [Malus domestica]